MNINFEKANFYRWIYILILCFQYLYVKIIITYRISVEHWIEVILWQLVHVKIVEKHIHSTSEDIQIETYSSRFVICLIWNY